MADDLTAAEVAEITGKARPVPQAKKLADMGVPFVFLGRAVRVTRAAAVAHELLLPVQAQPFDIRKVR